MAPNSSGWWTDERVDATVTSQYVHSHLRPNEAEQLTKSVFGDLSDDTYLEWILTRSKRFFLTLVEAGVPDQIFGVIDDSWDDEDLPIPEDEVPGLLLSAEPDKALDRRFYRAQFKYLIRIVGDGEHIRYAQEETIPVTLLGLKPVINKAKDSLDKIKLPSDNRRVFARKKMLLRNRFMEEEFLAEMAEWRTFAHEHILSIFGSYTTEDSLYVLMTPSPEYSLKSFLNDTPKPFETLSKPARRKLVLQWPHCLANGLAWLHHNKKHHGAIRPSRVLLDEGFRIYLGQFDGSGILCDGTVKDDIEAYQYAAPERWKRSVTIQATGNARTVLPSGGRTGRRLTMEPERTLSGGSQESHPSASSRGLKTARPTSVSYAFSPTSKSGSRLKLGSTKAAVTKMNNNLSRSESRQTSFVTDGLRPIRSSLEDHARPGAQSAMSTNSNDTIKARRQTGPIYASTPEMRTAVVQTWASAQHDQLAADVFSLGAIMMDILTFLCKRSYSSFARHRAAKNKSAGRGGGLADASFHANIGQVFTWAEMLQKDADKKSKKEDGNLFKAVGPCLQVVLQCLDREPAERLHAVELHKKLCEHIRDFAGLEIPQCCLQGELDRSEERPQSRGQSAERTRQSSFSRQQLSRVESRTKSRPDMRLSEKSVDSGFTPRIDSLRISPAKLGDFKFDSHNTYNTASATLIGSEQKLRDKSRERQDSFTFAMNDGVEVFPRPPTASSAAPSRRRYPQTETGEHSPAVSPTLGSGRPTFQPISTLSSVAPSTVGAITEDFHSVYSYTPPPSAHPTRELPPIPLPTSSRTPPSGSNPNLPNSLPTRSTTRNIQQLPMSDSEPTALPALPSIERHNLHSSALNSGGRRTTTRRTSRMDDLDEITPVEAANPRHYRSPSRTGNSNENRAYVSTMGRDKLGLRGLQYP